MQHLTVKLRFKVHAAFDNQDTAQQIEATLAARPVRFYNQTLCAQKQLNFCIFFPRFSIFLVPILKMGFFVVVAG